MRAILLGLLLCNACVPNMQPEVTYELTSTEASASVQPNASGCPFDILRLPPTRPFVELGNLDTDGDYSASAADFRDAAGAQICNVGGDAVIVHVNRDGYYASATIIQYTGAHPPA